MISKIKRHIKVREVVLAGLFILLVSDASYHLHSCQIQELENSTLHLLTLIFSIHKTKYERFIELVWEHPAISRSTISRSTETVLWYHDISKINFIPLNTRI